jgi:glycerol-3-phosphate dehydrogenase (NAD(P)+)
VTETDEAPASRDRAAARRRARPYRRLAVAGAGAWGTALAIAAARAGREVVLWGRDAEAMAELARTRENRRRLPGCALPGAVAPVADGAALAEAEALLLAVPAQTVRETCRALASHLAPGAPVALCAKGIELGTGRLLPEAVRKALPGRPVGVLSGPTFADETAKGYPTAATIAFPFAEAERRAPEAAPAARLAVSLGSESFRPYLSDDVTGVAVCGAMKNVIAIACGMMTGAGFAENTRAALVTRGLAEMGALAGALGGRRETLMGLAGVGDLTLSCSSTHSRNMALGAQLGRGLARAECFEGRPVVVEGEATARAIAGLAARAGVELPICEAVRRILHEGAPLAEAFAGLWARPIRAEALGLELALDHPSDAAAVRRHAETLGRGDRGEG